MSERTPLTPGTSTSPYNTSNPTDDAEQLRRNRHRGAAGGKRRTAVILLLIVAFLVVAAVIATPIAVVRTRENNRAEAEAAQTRTATGGIATVTGVITTYINGTPVVLTSEIVVTPTISLTELVVPRTTMITQFVTDAQGSVDVLSVITSVFLTEEVFTISDIGVGEVLFNAGTTFTTQLVTETITTGSSISGCGSGFAATVRENVVVSGSIQPGGGTAYIPVSTDFATAIPPDIGVCSITTTVTERGTSTIPPSGCGGTATVNQIEEVFGQVSAGLTQILGTSTEFVTVPPTGGCSATSTVTVPTRTTILTTITGPTAPPCQTSTQTVIRQVGGVLVVDGVFSSYSPTITQLITAAPGTCQPTATTTIDQTVTGSTTTLPGGGGGCDGVVESIIENVGGVRTLSGTSLGPFTTTASAFSTQPNPSTCTDPPTSTTLTVTTNIRTVTAGGPDPGEDCEGITATEHLLVGGVRTLSDGELGPFTTTSTSTSEAPNPTQCPDPEPTTTTTQTTSIRTVTAGGPDPGEDCDGITATEYLLVWGERTLSDGELGPFETTSTSTSEAPLPTSCPDPEPTSSAVSTVSINTVTIGGPGEEDCDGITATEYLLVWGERTLSDGDLGPFETTSTSTSEAPLPTSCPDPEPTSSAVSTVSINTVTIGGPGEEDCDGITATEYLLVWGERTLSDGELGPFETTSTTTSEAPLPTTCTDPEPTSSAVSTVSINTVTVGGPAEQDCEGVTATEYLLVWGERTLSDGELGPFVTTSTTTSEAPLPTTCTDPEPTPSAVSTVTINTVTVGGPGPDPEEPEPEDPQESTARRRPASSSSSSSSSVRSTSTRSTRSVSAITSRSSSSSSRSTSSSSRSSTSSSSSRDNDEDRTSSPPPSTVQRRSIPGPTAAPVKRTTVKRSIQNVGDFRVFPAVDNAVFA